MDDSFALSLRRIDMLQEKNASTWQTRRAWDCQERFMPLGTSQFDTARAGKPENHRMTWRAKKHTLCLPFAYSYFKRK